MYVPGWVKVNVKEAPVESESDTIETGEPVSETIVWGALSWFVQVTVVPLFTVSGVGTNAKFLIAIVFSPPVAAGDATVAGAVWGDVQPATVQARITMTMHVVQNTRRECSDIFS